MGLNLYALHLKYIKEKSRSDALKRVLDTMNNVIKESDNMIDIARKSKNEDYLDSVADEETSFIEELLGAAFVVCQSYITSITSDFEKLHQLSKNDNLTLTITDGKKVSLCKTGSVHVASSGYTEIQIINEFANYFKHCDQWPLDWNSATDKLSKNTIQAIQSVGARSGSTGNMRIGAEALGNSRYNNLDLILDKIVHWRDELLKQYQVELEHLGAL